MRPFVDGGTKEADQWMSLRRESSASENRRVYAGPASLLTFFGNGRASCVEAAEPTEPPAVLEGSEAEPGR